MTYLYLGHVFPHIDVHGSCQCGCADCVQPSSGRCACRGCNCATYDQCRGDDGTCRLCRPVRVGA